MSSKKWKALIFFKIDLSYVYCYFLNYQLQQLLITEWSPTWKRSACRSTFHWLRIIRLTSLYTLLQTSLSDLALLHSRLRMSKSTICGSCYTEASTFSENTSNEAELNSSDEKNFFETLILEVNVLSHIFYCIIFPPS